MASLPQDPQVSEPLSQEQTANQESEHKILAIICAIDQVPTRIPKADSLALVTICNYQVIIKPSTWNVSMESLDQMKGKIGIMFFIDAVIPKSLQDLPCFAGLKDSHMGKRVRTIKLLGQLSQGLFLSLDSVPNVQLPTEPGTDVTKQLGIIKYFSPLDPECPETESNDARGGFPSFIPKTDEPRLQTHQSMLQQVLETKREVVISTKLDGQSCTWYYRNGTVGVCSRNFQINPNDQIQFKTVDALHQFSAKLKTSGRNIAIQMEIYGPRINGNRAKCSKVHCAIFNVWDIDDQSYWPHDQVERLCQEFDWPMVPVIYQGPIIESYDSVPKLIALADSIRFNGEQGEGIVVKTAHKDGPRLSFKVISPIYLLKEK